MCKERGLYWLDLIVASILVVIGLKISNGLESVLDVHGCDENSYALNGALFPYIRLASNWAPLYTMWHALLLSITPDRVDEFYLNYRVLIIAPPLLMYLAMRSYSVSPLVALPFAWFFLTSTTNVVECPKVNSFNLVIVFLAVLVSSSIKPAQRTYCLLATATLCMSYVRPELFYGAIALWGAYGIFTVRQVSSGNYKRGSRLAALPYFFCSVSLFLVLGNPLHDANYNRDLEAFGQSFTRNWAEWSGRTINFYSEWEPVVKEHFGDINGWFDAFCSKPFLFLKHVSTNLSRIPEVTVSALFSRYYLADTSDRWIAFAVMVLLFYLRSTFARAQIARNARQHYPVVIFLFVALMSSFASVCIGMLNGRSVYTITALLVALLAILTIPTVASTRTFSLPSIFSLVLSVLLLLVTPRIRDARGEASNKTQTSNVRTIRLVQSLRLAPNPTVLCCPRYLIEYLGPQFTVPESNLTHITDDSNMNPKPTLIVLAPTCEQEILGIEILSKLRAEPRRYGYTKYSSRDYEGEMYLTPSSYLP